MLIIATVALLGFVGVTIYARKSLENAIEQAEADSIAVYTKIIERLSDDYKGI